MVETEIIYYFKKLYEMGDITLFEGNISAREGNDIIITPSQMSKEKITGDMLVRIDMEGNAVTENGYKPSSEFKMHLALYSMREDVRAVVHTHSAFATAFAYRNVPIRGNLAELEIFFGGDIPCCSYGKPGTDDVYRDFRRYFAEEEKNVVLLERHGLTAAGGSVEEAFARAQTAEKIAKIMILSKLV